MDVRDDREVSPFPSPSPSPSSSSPPEVRRGEVVFTYLGNDPKDFVEGHTRIYLHSSQQQQQQQQQQQKQHLRPSRPPTHPGGVSRLGCRCDACARERHQAALAHRAARRISAADFDVAPIHPGRRRGRVALDLPGMQQGPGARKRRRGSEEWESVEVEWDREEGASAATSLSSSSIDLMNERGGLFGC